MEDKTKLNNNNNNNNTITGTIDFARSGDAYVKTPDSDEDVYIKAGGTRDALHGDTVEVSVQTDDRGRRKGKVIKVIQRRRTDFIGTARVTKNLCFVAPDGKAHVDFFVPLRRSGGALDGQKVLVRMTGWDQSKRNPSGEVVEVLGYPGLHDTEMHAIIAEFGLPGEFPREVEEAAKNISPAITDEEVAKRRDFRGVTTITIDPHDAKDFDDAISFRELEPNRFEVGVHIADVSHYVTPGDVLDAEALERATSVYLVDRVIPMLPEVLSNGLCSLRPNEDKLCFSAVFEMDNHANILSEWFGRTVIHSDRRFTYEEAQEVIEQEKGEHCTTILLLDGLAKKLRAKREESGAISFDKEEVKFQLDEAGRPVEIHFKTQKDAHRLVEDFMLLANQKVAWFLASGRNPSVYRVHAEPTQERLAELARFVLDYGYSIDITGGEATARSISKLLADVKGRPEAGTIDILAIRTMAKAAYGTDNVGHFGLGFEHYTHFTSPIRRYPDVMVHRLLQAAIDGGTYSDRGGLDAMCARSSEREKSAADAERASVKYKQVEFMTDRVGQEFDATVSGVTEWGMYVEVTENRCEGMIRMRDEAGDAYEHDAKGHRYVGRETGTVYALGDRLRVVVTAADLGRKQLSFGLAAAASESDRETAQL